MAWTFWRLKGELGKRKWGGVFEEEFDTPMHTMYIYIYHISINGLTSTKNHRKQTM